MKWQTNELYLRQLLAQQLEIPVLGKIFFLMPSGSSTSLYEDWYRNEMDIPEELLFVGATAIKEAYAACTGDRNDVVLVAPGSYLMTEAITWAKNNTHLVGMAGPANNTNWNTGHIRFRTATTSIDALFDVTGNLVQFRNVGIVNHGNHADNKAALKLTSAMAFYGKGLHIRGARESTQASQADCCSLWIYTNSSSDNEAARFDDCKIGNALNPAHSGPTIYFSGAPSQGSSHIEFHNCRIMDQLNGAAQRMVEMGTGANTDRYTYFNNCLFYNFRANWTTKANEVFKFAGSIPTKDVVLHHCMAVGFDQWTDATTGDCLVIDMPGADLDGGLAQMPTSTI